MGRRREISIIFYRPVTRSDLKQERSFFRGSVSSFLQLVVVPVYYRDSDCMRGVGYDTAVKHKANASALQAHKYEHLS